jgi:hypothetical protein
MTERSWVIAVLLAATAAAPPGDASAQTPARLATASARIDPAAVSVQAVTPAEAHARKSAGGSRVLLIDIRSWDEVESTGSAEGIDAVGALPRIRPSGAGFRPGLHRRGVGAGRGAGRRPRHADPAALPIGRAGAGRRA